jgi:hypothetical protein
MVENVRMLGGQYGTSWWINRKATDHNMNDIEK